MGKKNAFKNRTRDRIMTVMNKVRKTNIIIYILIILKGFIIGIANIIPGVSGGTVALILNIYKRMITSIGNLSFSTIKAIIKLFSFRKKHFYDFKKEMMRVDAPFLVLLLIGAAAAIIIFSNLITILLETRHDITYGFFFGLILVSIVIPFSKIKNKSFKVFLSILIGIILIIALSFVISDEQQISNAKTANEMSMASQAIGIDIDIGKLIMMFLTGILVTSAMILPGISGSFIALVMGQYFLLLQAVSERDLLILGIFAIGGLIGLKFFAKVMNYLFKKCHDVFMAFISGLVLGSLWIMWPFKNTFI
ncbi:MAG TPA: hypothetical protein DCP02_00735, partial [Actinobacteria bacterium]|nr:hypothetical protein [Actinomycetota bacterium]